MSIGPDVHLPLVHLVSGSAFAVLGVTALLLRSGRSALHFERHLGWLVGFGLVHGLMEIAVGLQVHEWHAMRALAVPAASMVSFAALLEFGRRAWNGVPGTRKLPLLPSYAALVTGVGLVAMASKDPSGGIEAGSGYFLGMPGALLAGVTLVLVKRAIAREPGGRPIVPWLHVAAAAFLGYGVLTLVPYTDSGRSPSLPAADDVIAAFGAPVVVLRAACGVLLATSFAALVRVSGSLIDDTLLRVVNTFGGFVYRSLVDSDRTVVALAGRVHTLSGYDADELLWSRDPSFGGMIHADDRERVFAALQSALEHRGEFDVSYRILTRAGREVWIRDQGHCLYDQRGRAASTEGFVTDDTERRTAELKLRRHGEMMDQVRAAVVALDLDGFVTEWTRGAQWVFGYTRDEMIGRHVAVLYPPDDDRVPRADVATPLRPEGARDTKVVLRRKSGETFHALLSLNPYCGTDGRAEGLLGYAIDISVHERVERARRESEEKVQFLLDSTDEGIYGLDVNGNCTFVNKACMRTLGYEREIDLVGKNMHDLICHTGSDGIPDPPADCRIYRGFGRTEGVRVDEHVLRRIDGSTFESAYRSLPIRAHGEITGYVVSFVDISRRKRAERALRQSEAQLARAQRMADLGYWRIDLHHEEVTYSPAVSKMFGLPPEARDFDSFMANIHPDDRREAADAFDRARTSAEGWDLEFRVNPSAKETKWVRSISEVETDRNGVAVEVVGTAQDITESKLASEKLELYAQQQEILLREVNHRVKNNLSTILSIIHREEERLGAGGQGRLQTILTDLANRVEGLATVHSLLSEGGWRPLRLDFLCGQVVRAALKGVPGGKRIDVDIVPSAVVVDSDQAHHLTLVINELATNVVKHALHGREQCRIEIEITGEGGNVVLRFSDDGPGLPAEIADGDYSAAGVGFELMRGIVSHSLDGRFESRNDGGVTITASFPATRITLVAIPGLD